MATRQNTDFLTFNAYSIKDMITRKLSEDKNVTDQIYEGSNLAILIDIFSYMAQTMLYNLNNAAAESMFADTQVYENMNRLVQFLGYTPHGMTPAAAQMKITSMYEDTAASQKIIPAYCYIDTGKTDKNGKKVYYSIDKSSFLLGNEDLITKFLGTNTYSNIFSGALNEGQKEVSLQFYNGIWQSYPTIFTAEGNDFETFVLTGLKSDAASNQFVAHNFIDVFVETGTGDQKRIEPYIANSGPLFKINKLSNKIFSSNDRVYSIRLNEDKTYSITFGDGINGKKLKRGDRIHILYLESNGSDTELAINEVYDAQLNFPAAILRDFDMNDFVKNILGISVSENNANAIAAVQEASNIASSLKATNITTATRPKDEEDVDEIRQNAPAWFRMGNRLVTKDDYEFYVKSREFKNTIIDVKCMNNWEYMSIFYKWLYELGASKQIKNPRYFLKPEKLVRYYKYSDPADANNIYLWTAIFQDKDNAGIMVEDFSDKIGTSEIKKDMVLIKDMTHEPTFVPPIRVKYAICANTNIDDESDYSNSVQYAIRENGGIYVLEDMNVTSDEKENYLEITLADNIVYSNNAIRAKVANVIVEAFNPLNNKLGQGVENDKIMNKILEINGIDRVRTIYHKKAQNGSERYTIKNGISFASWSDLSQINGSDFTGIDLEVSNGTRSLLPFQFPVLTEVSSLVSHIVIIKHSTSYLNEVVY